MVSLIENNSVLKWNHETQTGCLFHILGAMHDFGKVGATCIANSPEEAQEMMQKVKNFLKCMQAK